MREFKGTVAITGGGGYVGSALVPDLIEAGYRVKVLDLFLYGEEVFDQYSSEDGLFCIKGDVRDPSVLEAAFSDTDAVIHLACISNDPSFELNPALGKSINLDAFDLILGALEKSPARRFIYASSSSVYGLREESDVTEQSPTTPLTDYSRFKLECEYKLQDWSNSTGIAWTILRPATVCGYARRLRLDLTVNVLTMHALENQKIKIFGGKQLRPNIHINDMSRVYCLLLDADKESLCSQVFNAGYQNETVENIAMKVKTVIGDGRIELEYVPSADTRSYHVNSEKIKCQLGFEAQYTIEDAIQGLTDVYRQEEDAA